MGRSSKVILAALLVGLATAALAYYGSLKFCSRHAAGVDDLAWLRQEFHLSDAEMARIRLLHEGYLPKCREMCERIAVKQTEVEAALAAGGETRGTAEQKLTELGTLRAQCQAQMLRHFEEVSRAMPAEQGKRYRTEMERLTLGFHEPIERSMGTAGHSGHGGH